MQAVEPAPLERPHDVRHVLVDAAAQLARDADAGPRGAGRRCDCGQLGELALHLAFELVGNLATAGREQLDPVVGVRVVTRRDDSPRRVAGSGEMRDGGRRHHTDEHDVGALGAQPRDERGFDHGPGPTGVATDDERLVGAEDAYRGAPECRDELGCQLAVRDAANAVGPEAKRHRDRPRAG